MATTPQSLFKFVQLRRLTDTAPEPCTTGAGVVRDAMDFSAAGTPPVRKAAAAGDLEQGTALYTERAKALTGDARAAAQFALRQLKLASTNERLTIGQVRANLKAWEKQTGITGARQKKAFGEAIAWAADMVILQRWLRPSLPASSGDPVRLLRGLGIVALSQAEADPGCRVRSLVAKAEVQLPDVVVPPPPKHPDVVKANQLDAMQADLARLQVRARASRPGADPTIEELGKAGASDMDAQVKAIQGAAKTMGLPVTTTASSMQEVLGLEAATARTKSPPSSPGSIASPGGPHIDIDDVITIPAPRPSVPVLTAEARVLGRGDLMLVRTALLRYEPNEISHIENVLATEVRERTHVLDVTTSETVTETSKSASETTRDLETTEQHGLERATATAASTSSSMSMGLSVSGGLGPIQAGIDIDASRSTTTSSSSSAAVSYAKTITERASETLRSEASYRRTVTSTTQVTETNLHKFDNTAGAANIAGIYRWVDRVDQAQMYNYGERLLLEFVVPEPAAQFVHLRQATEAADPIVPPPGWNLEITELTEANYVRKAARWNVLGLETPPPLEVFTTASFADPAARPFDYKTDSTDQSQPEWGYSSYVNEVAIPEGYAAATAWATVTWGLSQGEYDTKDSGTTQNTQAVEIVIGSDKATISDSGDSGAEFDLNGEVGGPLPIAVSADQRGGFAMAVRVKCQRTREAFEAWRLKTYETIRAGYLSLQQQYETALSVAEIRQAYAATTPSDMNRTIEMRELKRACQTVMTGQDFDLYGAMTFPAGEIPRVDASEATAEADSIQFFEDLFEWENLVYLFYPYQWAGRSRWAELLSRSSTDPLHEAFLQAGAARVVVPVRSGYEHAVGRYLATSVVPSLEPATWRGQKNPYPPIEELIADGLDRPGDEVAVGDPWEVVTPTSLVYLQAGADLNPADGTA
ncbi:MAG: hypothetical protein IT355_06740 [Gemmatimonadaceae bacterium]|nr:hypothetical protein [Gemmatimonadaceae bacterium]